jgi:hypothetical protein
MAMIRVPYPADPEQRRSLFERAAAKLAKFGRYEGTPDSGTFRGSTPIGEIAGSYRSEAGSETLEIELIKKPWLVPTSLIENEIRKQIVQV